MGTRCQLKNVRIAFINALSEARDYQDNKKFRYSATFIVDPDSEADKVIQAAIVKEAKSSFGSKSEQMLEMLKTQPNKYCYQKDKKNSSGDIYEGFSGKYALAANRRIEDGPPLLLDNIRDPEIQKAKRLTGKEGRIYGGCYVNASVEIWAQLEPHSGMRASLLVVQFHKDGDSFGGVSRPNDDDFNALAEIPEEDLY
jgi:hypothetical protein